MTRQHGTVRIVWLSLLLLFATGLNQMLFAQPFVHPGRLSTQADFDRMAANEQPWKEGCEKMIALACPDQLELGTGHADRSGQQWRYFARCQRDALAIYLNALRYRITGNTAYADKAIQGMDLWSSTMTNYVGGDVNGHLAVGLCGWEFATAGETLRGYGGWASATAALPNPASRILDDAIEPLGCRPAIRVRQSHRAVHPGHHRTDVAPIGRREC